VARIDRAFADLLISPDWEPHTPTLQYGVFASRWPVRQKSLWTMVNRNEYDVSGEQIAIPSPAGRRFYDLWHGVVLEPRISGGTAILSFSIEGNGFGAILALDGTATVPALDGLLAEMRTFSLTPSKSLSHEWHFLR
jgi:hypothetical protein